MKSKEQKTVKKEIWTVSRRYLGEYTCEECVSRIIKITQTSNKGLHVYSNSDIIHLVSRCITGGLQRCAYEDVMLCMTHTSQQECRCILEQIGIYRHMRW